MESKNKRVYVINWRNYDTGEAVFKTVLFSEEAVHNWLAECKDPKEYEVETFEETENGGSKEILFSS